MTVAARNDFVDLEKSTMLKDRRAHSEPNLSTHDCAADRNGKMLSHCFAPMNSLSNAPQKPIKRPSQEHLSTCWPSPRSTAVRLSHTSGVQQTSFLSLIHSPSPPDSHHRPIVCHRSLFRVPSNPPVTHEPLLSTMSTASGLSSELSNALEQQSNRTSCDSRSSIMLGFSRPNSIEESRSSLDCEIAASPLSNLRGPIDVHSTSLPCPSLLPDVPNSPVVQESGSKFDQDHGCLIKGQSLSFPAHDKPTASALFDAIQPVPQPSVPPSCVMSVCTSEEFTIVPEDPGTNVLMNQHTLNSAQVSCTQKHIPSVDGQCSPGFKIPEHVKQSVSVSQHTSTELESLAMSSSLFQPAKSVIPSTAAFSTPRAAVPANSTFAATEPVRACAAAHVTNKASNADSYPRAHPIAWSDDSWSIPSSSASPARSLALSSATPAPATFPQSIPENRVSHDSWHSSVGLGYRHRKCRMIEFDTSADVYQPGSTYTSPRTSSDPVARPSTDIAFESDLNMRVARTRQTMDYAARQRSRFGTLSRARLTPLEILSMLESVPRTPDEVCHAMSTQSHAILCAQWCMHEFPGRDWAPLVGLMHDAGRILRHPTFGSEPAWAVTSESYPLGCRFSESINGYFFLHACPDRRCSAYASPTGIYTKQCGLDSTHFTWSGPEYLSLVLLKNGVRLPFEAMFLLRYQNFESAINDNAYVHLMTREDIRCMPLLRKFFAVKRAAAVGAKPPNPCSRDEVVLKCEEAIKKYFPQPHLNL